MSQLKHLTGLTLALALSLSTAGIVQAQTATELTADQMTEAFKKQKTRGLVLVPPAAAPATDAPAASAAASAETAPAAAATTSVTAAYQPVDKDQQVNIQISFDFDSATLREDQKPKLSTLCQAMKSVDVSVFQIIGHTDSSGSAAYNENLSLLRAQEVKRFLVSDCQIPAERLEAIGMGERAPYDAADPRSDQNRRVEFQALG
ncbi:OmpA family protein [Phaeovulum sp. W22_SRMD_FR3]|uniref:OmpA family protein n=1 Tax=Phaeovulum sp. W22_SRMD_FR3 TaxID=3240274 RepID=UPI003F9BFA20